MQLEILILRKIANHRKGGVCFLSFVVVRFSVAIDYVCIYDRKVEVTLSQGLRGAGVRREERWVRQEERAERALCSCLSVLMLWNNPFVHCEDLSLRLT